MALPRWKMGCLFFAGYVMLSVALAYLSVAGHVAHGDTFDTQASGLPAAAVVADRLLFVIGLPASACVAWLDTQMKLHLPPLYAMLLFIANGIMLAYLAALACGRFNRPKP